MITVFSPSQALCSAMTWAWVQMSWVKQDNCKTKFINKFSLTCGDSCGSSLGWVWIQPRGSNSERYSWLQYNLSSHFQPRFRS